MFGLNSLSFHGPDPISFPGFCASSGERPRDVLRIHLHILRGQILEEQGAGELDGDPDRPVVDHLSALVLVERAQDAGPDSDGSGLDDPIQRELDVLGGDGLPIVPLRLSQAERIGFPVATHRPALAQVAHDLVGIDRIVVDKPVELRRGGHEAVGKGAARVDVPLARVEAGDPLEDHLLVFPLATQSGGHGKLNVWPSAEDVWASTAAGGAATTDIKRSNKARGSHHPLCLCLRVPCWPPCRIPCHTRSVSAESVEHASSLARSRVSKPSLNQL